MDVARIRRSLRGWTGALVGLVALARCGAGVLSFFALGPLTGLALYPLWEIWGTGPIVTDWLLAALFTAAGVTAATRMNSVWGYRRARIVGWFVVVDTVVYVASTGGVLIAEAGSHNDPWWKILAAILVANLALAGLGLKVIHQATSAYRIQRQLLRGNYIRKRRLTDAHVAW